MQTSVQSDVDTLIRTEVTQVIRERCQCDFQEIFISRVLPLCENDEPLQVVYRAQITSYASYPASQLVSYIEEWVRQGVSITSGIFMVTFDSECPVEVSDIDEPVCGPNAGVCLQSSVASAAIAASLAIIIVLTIVAVLLMVVVCLIRQKRIL